MASVTIKNIGRLTQKLNNVANMDLTEKMVKATTLVHGQAKELAPVGKINGGNLGGSIHMEVKNRGSGVEGRVFTNLQYAAYVEFGTGSKGNGTYPYKIRGVSLKYRGTSWIYTPDGGETFYHTNGQVAKPYMYPALKRNEKYIKQLFKEGVKESIKGG